MEAFTFGTGGLREALDKPSLSFCIEVDVELSESSVSETEEEIRRRRAGFEEAKPERAAKVVERALRYRIKVEYRPKDQVLRVVDEELVPLKRGGDVRESRNPFLSVVKKDGKQVLRLRLEGQGARPAEFEIGLPYTLLSRPHYAPHYPHIDAFKREVSGWRFYYLEPQAMRSGNDLKTVSVPGRSGEDLAAFFDTLKARRPKQFDATRKALSLLLPGIKSVDVERAEDGFLRLMVYESGVPFSSRVMSEGTLRLLGFLAILQPHTPATVVGFEEPENGVHPTRIATVARVLENAGEGGSFQVIVNTHSPLLASSVPPEALLVCRKTAGGTVFEAFSSGPLLRNQQIEEALASEDTEPPSTELMERIIRGDFGG